LGSRSELALFTRRNLQVSATSRFIFLARHGPLLMPISTIRVEWFKLFLDPLVLRDGQVAASARLPQLPTGKEPIDCITDYLGCIWRYAKERIIDEIGIVADLGEPESSSLR
jgi:hypothetical protein